MDNETDIYDSYGYNFLDDLVKQMTVVHQNKYAVGGAHRVNTKLHPELSGVKISELNFNTFSDSAWALLTNGAFEIWILPKPYKKGQK